jgi:hypothetical protein
VFVEQDVLQLEVTMDTGFAVNIGNGSDKLGKNPLDFADGEGTMVEKIVVQLITWRCSSAYSSL